MPGWRGVRVDWGDNAKWEPDYEGKFMAMAKDRAGSHWRMIGLADSVEEAAKMHDEEPCP